MLIVLKLLKFLLIKKIKYLTLNVLKIDLLFLGNYTWKNWASCTIFPNETLASQREKFENEKKNSMPVTRMWHWSPLVFLKGNHHLHHNGSIFNEIIPGKITPQKCYFKSDHIGENWPVTSPRMRNGLYIAHSIVRMEKGWHHYPL